MRGVSSGVVRALAIFSAAVMVLTGLAAVRSTTSPGPPAPASNPNPEPRFTGTGLPTLDPDDGKFFGVAGGDIATLEGIQIHLYVGVLAGTGTFTLGLFDGDVGDSWDDSTNAFSYKLFKDPLKNGTTAKPLDTITGSDATDDAWFEKSYSTDGDAKAPSGNYFYRLDATWTSPNPSNGFNNFKVRTSGQISVAAGQDFGFSAGPQNPPPFGSDPPLGSGDPHPGDQNDAGANSYDGEFTFYFYVPAKLSAITFWDGDNDQADDTDDPNTPNTDPDGSGPAQDEGVNHGFPPDDNNGAGGDAFRVSPSIFYDILDPQGHLFTNDNPSGNKEWERFVVGDSTSDPDVTVSYQLQPGLWRYRVQGMDAHNLNVLRSTYEIYSTTDLPLTVNPPPSIIPDNTKRSSDNVTLYYSHTVKNEGVSIDDFSLSATSAHGWATAIYADSNGNGVLDPGEPKIEGTGPMAPGQELPILLELKVPDLTSGTTDVTTVTASSTKEWALQGNAKDTTIINSAPTAALSVPSPVPEGTTVPLDASGSSDPDGDSLQYRWDFNGDGTWDTAWSSESATTYTWGDDFSGTVVVEVTDGDLTDTEQAPIQITNVAPSVSLNLIPSGDEGSLLTFEARIQDPGSDDLTITWSGDCTGWSAPTFYPNDPSGTPDPFPSPDVNPRDVTDTQSVTCGDDGSFMWSVHAMDDDGGATTMEGTFSVNNLPPSLAVAPPSVSVSEATQVTLQATASDPGSDDLTFTWSWDFRPTEVHAFYNDGVGPDPPNSPGGTYPFVASDSSTRTYGDDCVCSVSLMVKDDDGGMVAYSTTITVLNVAPAPSIDSATQDAGKNFPAGRFFPFLPINFTGSGGDPGSDDLTFTWDFGDGATSAGTTYYNNGLSADPFPSVDGGFPFTAKDLASHSYRAAGDYVVKLTVKDDDGGTATASFPIHITSPDDLKHEAIKRIKALKEQALARDDNHFLDELDESEEEVWESLGFEHPFHPDAVAALPANDVTAKARDHDKVRLTLGPSWDPKLPSYRTLRLTWSNGVVTTLDLPKKWPDKNGDLRADPWVDAWHQDVRIHTERDKKAKTLTLDIHAHEASLNVAVSLDGDPVAQLVFGYKMEHLWVDASHLDPKEGKEVFEEEEDAVEELVCLSGGKGHGDDDSGPNAGILSGDSGDDDGHKRCHGNDEDDHDGDNGGTPPTVLCRGLTPKKWTDSEIAALDKECDLIANLLVKADELLALTALNDAKEMPIKNPKYTKQVMHEIEESEEELQEAYKEWSDLEYEEAIEEFGDAWEHAQHAIKFANKT